MRNLLPAFLLFTSSFSFAQSVGPNTNVIIDTNNIAAGFNSAGDLFSKDTFVSSNFTPYGEFRVPKAGAAHSIFSGNIWVAGKDIGGNLHSSSELYGSRYQPGPSHTGPQDSVAWNNIWAISRVDVLSVKNDFDTHHAITLPVPASVLGWPAKGNASATGNGGVSLVITQDMAPFVDRNGDGVYNVYDGDYPLVRGDKMLWWINNDAGSQSQNPMGVDRRYSVYEYSSATDSNLNNTLFLSVSIKNQSGAAYDSLLIGSFVDFDLGCANNDRTGSIPAKSTFYVYNGFVAGGVQSGGVTCDEGPVCPTGEVGYGCSLPIMSATFLNDTLKVYNYYTNGAASGQADPSTDPQFYNYLNGKWSDGTPLTFGGNGYGGSTAYPFAFPGNPADASQWSECNPQTGPAIAAGDRRSVGVIGPFALAAGDTISFDMAFVFHPGPFDNCPDFSDSSVVSQHIDSIRRYYQSETFPQWYTNAKALSPGFYNVGINEVASGTTFSLIPNPNNGNFNLHVSNANVSEYAVTITDMLGRIVYRNTSAHVPDQAVQLTDVTTGVYTVSLEAQNYKATKKIIITK